MKIWEKVNNITGNSTKARFLVEYINAGAKFILAALPEKFLWTVASETEIDGWDSDGNDMIGEGSAIAYDKILAVYRHDGVDLNGNKKKRIAAEAPDDNIHIFDEDNSLLRATNMFPKFYKLGGKIFIKPDPDWNNDSIALDTQGNPTSANDHAYYKLGESTTTNVPAQTGDKGIIVYSAPPIVDENDEAWILTEYENVAIFYAGSLDFLRLSSVYRDLCKSEVDEVVGADGLLDTYRTKVTNSSFDPTTATDGSTNVAIPNKVISFNVGTPLPSFSFSGNLPSNMVIPESIPSSFTFTEDLPTFAFTDSLPVGLNVSKTLPTSISETNSLPSSITLSAVLPSDINITSSLPSAFSAPTTSIPSGVNIVTPLPTFSISSTLPDDFSNTLDLPTMGIDVYNFSSTDINDALTNAKNLVDVDISDDDLSSAESAAYWLSDEDTEMVSATLATAGQEINRATSELGVQKTKLEEFASKVNSNVSKFSAELTKYQAKTESELADAKVKSDKYNSEVSKETGKVGSDIQKYQAEVQKETGRVEHEVNKYKAEVDKELSKVKTEVDKYNIELTKEINRVTSGIQKFEQQIVKDVQVYQKEIEVYNSEIQGEAAKKGIDITVYQRELEKEVQRVNSEMAKYQASLGKSVQDFTLDLQKYGAAYTKESQRITADLARYGASVTKEGQRVQLELAKYNAELGKDAQEFNAKLQKYNADLQSSSTSMQKDIQQFTLDLNNYNSLIQAKVGKFNSDMAEANSYLQEAGTKLQSSQIYAGKSSTAIATSRDYYQRSVSELSAITGAVTAPPQQQQTQRQEQGATS